MGYDCSNSCSLPFYLLCVNVYLGFIQMFRLEVLVKQWHKIHLTGNELFFHKEDLGMEKYIQKTLAITCLLPKISL